MKQILNILKIRGPFFVLLLSLYGCATSPPIMRGSLSGSIVWEGTVHIDGDLIIEEESLLTIRPGTTVLFLTPSSETDRYTTHPHFPGSELIIRGELLAEGTPSSPITFRHIDPLAPQGSWGGINLMNSRKALFRYCRFTQADSAIHAQQTRVLVEESLFEKNLVALRFHTTEIRIANNLIRHNGTGIRFHFGSPEIVSNEIIANGKSFFITSFPKDYRIAENNIVESIDYNVVLGEEVPDDVTMLENYWGNDDPKAIAPSFFDGRVDTDLGRVEFAPFSPIAFQKAGISWTP